MLPCICLFSEISLLEGYISNLVVKYTQSQFPQIPVVDFTFPVSLATTAKVLGSKKYCKNLKFHKILAKVYCLFSPLTSHNLKIEISHFMLRLGRWMSVHVEV